MSRQDIPHYTTEEVDAVIAAALAVATSDDVPESLRGVVFTQTASMLAAKTVQIMQPQPLDLDLAQRIQQGRP